MLKKEFTIKKCPDLTLRSELDFQTLLTLNSSAISFYN